MSILCPPDELFASMAGGRVFSKIDLRQAYLQLQLAEENRVMLTLSTHKGLFKCNRLMYGVASASAIWQRTMEGILSGIPGIAIFLDDDRIMMMIELREMIPQKILSG